MVVDNPVGKNSSLLLKSPQRRLEFIVKVIIAISPLVGAGVLRHRVLKKTNLREDRANLRDARALIPHLQVFLHDRLSPFNPISAVRTMSVSQSISEQCCVSE